MSDGTELCKDDELWVCGACGKTSRSHYGFDKDEKSVASPGWDESCMMNSSLFKKEELTYNDSKTRVIHAGFPKVKVFK